MNSCHFTDKGREEMRSRCGSDKGGLVGIINVFLTDKGRCTVVMTRTLANGDRKQHTIFFNKAKVT